MLQRTSAAGFIAPCLPTKTDKLPSGSHWLHEIKHDGFRIIARKDGSRVRLYSRPGNDLTRRFPLIAEAAEREAEKEWGKKGGDDHDENAFH
jgi:bifunctional non-homologous end joining protein LigD